MSVSASVCVQVCQSLSLISLFCAHLLFLVCVIPCFPSMFISLDLLISPNVVSSQSPGHVMVYCLPLCNVSLPSSLLSFSHSFVIFDSFLFYFESFVFSCSVQFPCGVLLIRISCVPRVFSFPSNPSVYLCQYAFPCVLPRVFNTPVWVLSCLHTDVS